MGSQDLFNMKLQRATWCVVYCLLGVARAADQGGYNGHDKYEYSPYHYEYNVDDDKEYLHFGQEEEDDGTGNVHGHYHVQLPDGRLQHVKYYVNGYSGYVAEVSYDGEAHHPSYHGSHGGHGGHHSSGSHRFGKALDDDSHSVVEKVELDPATRRITRTRLEKSEQLDSSSSEQVNVFVPAPLFQ